MALLAFQDSDGRLFSVTSSAGVVATTYEKFYKSYPEKNVKCLDIDLDKGKLIKKIYYSTGEGDVSNLVLADTLAELSHEINNPLAIVMSSLKILEKLLGKEKLNNEEMILENVGDVKESIERVRAIMANARNLVNCPQELFQVKELSEIVEDVKSQFLLVFSEYDIMFSVDIEKDLENVHVNVMGTTLNQCLFNLINNAFYEVKSIDGERNIRIKISKKNKISLVLSVEDNGRGIPVDLRESIFELNFSTKGQEGSGIGLHLVRKYAELNHGSLNLDVSHLKGAKFDLEFPIEVVETIKKTVLIVDDEVDLLELIRSLLEKDYSVLVSSSVNNAFNLLKNNSVDIIISDFDMPSLSGFDFLKMARGIRPSVPFILFSAYISDSVKEIFKNEKKVKLIEKPDIEALKKEISLFHSKKS